MMKTLLSYLLLMACCPGAPLSWLFPTPKPSLQPDNPFCFFGEELVLTCTFDGKNSSLGYLSERNDNVTEEYLSRPDDKTLVYKVTNTSGFERKISSCEGLSFTCWHPDFVMPDGQILHADYKPETPRNIDCVYYNELNVWCTWDLVPTFKCPQDYSVTSFLNTSHGRIIMCKNSSNSSCQSGEVSSLEIVDLVVEIKHKNRSKNSFTTTFDLAKRVKPQPVTDLSVTVINSRNINVNWTHRKAPTNIIVRTIITPLNGTNFIQKLEKNGTGKEWMIVEGLKPAVKYTISVDVLPSQGGIWSKPESTDFTMASDAPDYGPPSTPGAYNQTNTCGGLSNQVRSVTVFWKELPEEWRNGALTKYVLKYFPSGQQSKESREEVPATETEAVLPSLACNQAYKVHIFAFNTLESTSYTEIEIPSSDAVAPVSQLLVRLSSDNVRAQWNASSTPDNFTLYWCKRQWSPPSCPINWMTVAGNHTEAVIPGLAPDSITPQSPDTKFGISTSALSGSSGIVWEECIHRDNAKLVKSPQSVKVINNTKVEVYWEQASCVDNVYVKDYQIRWCLASKFSDNNCSSGGGSVLVPVAKGGHVLTELQPSRLYMVVVEARTLDNLLGPSISYAAFLSPAGLDEGQTAGLVLGLLSAIILVGAIIFCIWKCKRMQPLEIQIEIKQPRLYGDISNPALTDDDEIPISSQSKAFKKQVSNDSGVGSQTGSWRGDKDSSKDNNKSPLSSPKVDQDYVIADGNVPFTPGFMSMFNPPNEQLRNVNIFTVHRYIDERQQSLFDPKATGRQALEANIEAVIPDTNKLEAVLASLQTAEAPVCCQEGNLAANKLQGKALAAPSGPQPAAVEEHEGSRVMPYQALQDTIEEATWSPPRAQGNLNGAYTTMPPPAAQGNPAMEGHGESSKAADREDADSCPLNHISEEELRALLGTTNKVEALEGITESEQPDAAETLAQVAPAVPGHSTQGYVVAAVPVVNGYVSLPQDKRVEALSHGDDFTLSQDAAAFENIDSNNPPKATETPAGFHVVPVQTGFSTLPHDKAAGNFSQNDNSLCLEGSISNTPPEANTTPAGFLLTPGQTGYIILPQDNRAALPSAPEENSSVDLPHDTAAATLPFINGYVSKPPDSWGEAQDANGDINPPGKVTFKTSSRNDDKSPHEASAGFPFVPAKNGYITLPASSTKTVPSQEGDVFPPQAPPGFFPIPTKTGYVAQPQDLMEGVSRQDGQALEPQVATHTEETHL